MKPSADPAAIQEAVETIKANPEMGKITNVLTSSSNGGLSVITRTGETIQGGITDTSRVGKFTTVGDEPQAVLGEDKGLSPVEFALQALAGCYTATLTLLAAQEGIELDNIELKLAADFDLNGFLKLNPDTRNGAQEIRADIHLTSPHASREELDQLVEKLPLYSPLYDMFTNPVPVINRSI